MAWTARLNIRPAKREKPSWVQMLGPESAPRSSRKISKQINIPDNLSQKPNERFHRSPNLASRRRCRNSVPIFSSDVSLPLSEDPKNPVSSASVLAGGSRRSRSVGTDGGVAGLPGGVPAAGPEVQWDDPGDPPVEFREEHRGQGAEGGAGAEHRLRAGQRPGGRQQAPHLGPGQADTQACRPPRPLLLSLPPLRARGPFRVGSRGHHRESSSLASKGITDASPLMT